MIEVLIAGGGPVGLTLAADLARWGVSFRIIDKKPEPETYSKAANFWPRTQEVTHAIGYGAKIMDNSNVVSISYIYAFGKHIGTLKQTPVKSPFQYGRSINQGQVERIVAEHLAEYGYPVERGRSLVSLQQYSDHVAAVIEDGQGQREIIQCRYLVGCEGVRSTAREAAGIHVEPQMLPDRALRQTDAKLTWNRPQKAAFHFFIDQDRFCGVVEMPGGYHRIFMCQPENEVPDRKPELDDILRDFRKIVGDDKATLSDPIWLTHGKFYYGYAPRLREGRVLLAGDSGHFSLPIGGQGMNTGIQDAFNLGWKLAWVLQGKANQTLLDTYSLERQQVKKELCDDQVSNFGTLLCTSPLRKWALMNLGPIILRLQKGVELRGRDETQLSINYPTSPMSVDKLSAKGVKAGDRCLDASVIDLESREEVKLYSKFYGPKLTLFIFDDGALESARQFLANMQPMLSTYDQLQTYIITADKQVNRYEPDRLLSDWNRDAHNEYGVKTPTVYLIRPDGHAGFRGGLDSGQALTAYIETFFQPYYELDQRIAQIILHNAVPRA